MSRFFAMCALAWLVACGAQPDGGRAGAPAAPVPSPSAQPVEIARDVLEDAVSRLVSGGGNGSVTPEEHAEVKAVYAAGGALWFDLEGRPSSDAREALDLLAAAPANGLEASTYETAGLRALAETAGSPDATPGERAAFDVALSLQTMRFWRDLHLGQVDPRALGYGLPAPTEAPDFPALLREAVAGLRLGAATEALVPPMVLYRAIARELARYRRLAEGEPTLAVPEQEPSIKPGMPFTQGPALRARLVALGDIPAEAPAAPAGTYDGALVDGIVAFQRRHGLEPDGVIGRRTAAALSVPLATRVRQLELALERLRWLPTLDPEGFLAVNIPMFHLWGWGTVPPDGAPAFEMDVIVGRALDTQTPLMVDEMQYLIFRPYWNVPPSIARGEVVPALARDPGYLDEQDMEIVMGWTDQATPMPVTDETIEQLRKGRLRVRQRPGPKNSLGAVKFSFPNDEYIYMHGTPATHLFGRPRRDFSHGCVRVADPVALAAWVLRHQPEWTRERIVEAMAGDRPLWVTLSKPVQVILFYLTAAVMPEDGSVHFAEDIYGHDRRLARALDESITR